MNVLIAIMADSYEMVKEHEKVEALHERAKMIADMELQHPGWHRYSQYMHICEAADDDSGLEAEWSGVAGRVKELLGDAQAELHSDVTSGKGDLAHDVAALRWEMVDEIQYVKDDVSALSSMVCAV